MIWSAFWALLPIAFLVVVMTKPRPWPSTTSFALAALLAGILGAWHFGHAPLLLTAAVVAGVLEALTPISIVLGAILFFLAMEKSGALATLQEWLRGVSPHPVAQVQIVGFAFLLLIEGAAGFGTPAALAAPMLVALGFPALSVAVVCLVFNSLCTIFGAVGTPVWFGFGPLHLSEQQLLAIGAHSAWLQLVAACVVPMVALRFLFPWRTIFRNAGFLLLSILSCMLPLWLVAQSNYEFPVIVSGVVGLPVTILLARWGVGLEKTHAAASEVGFFSRGLWLAALPLLLTVVVLLLTRIPALGLRGVLTSTEPLGTFPLGAWGQAQLTTALALRWQDILGQGLNWSYQTLYVPAWIPFAITAVLAMVLGRMTPRAMAETVGQAVQRVRTPALALAAALVLVKLLMLGGEGSATMILGETLAAFSGTSWAYFAPVLGALGSFFSGSTTISNLTFGGIQLSIAEVTGLSPLRILALQLSGASMGNMICIHNIVAVCAVLGLVNQEGIILRKTLGVCVLFALVLAACVAWG